MYNNVHLGTIGTDYRGTPNQLGGCVADAVTWGKRFHPVAQRTLDRIEGEATLQGILDLVDDLCSGAKPGDLVIITRSGHGTQVPDRSGDETDGKDEAFVPHDYRNGLLLDDTYRAALAKHPQIYKMLIDDFCHSGTAARAFQANPLAVIPGMPRFIPFHSLEGEMCPKAVANLCGKRPRRRGGLESVDEGVIQIAGCLDTEFSYDATFNGKPNGACTYFLNRAYDQLAAGATFAGWFKELRKYLPKVGMYPQTPQLNASEALKDWVVPGLNPIVPQPQQTAKQVITGKTDAGVPIRIEVG